MQPLTADTPFRSGRTLASAVVFLLAAHIAADVILAFSAALQIATGAAARVPEYEESLNLYDMLDLGIGMLYLLVFGSTIVFFCMWLYRASRNLVALGTPRHALEYSPGWAVGSFFVPFVNLVVPYRAVRETWAKSEPAVGDETYMSPSPPGGPAFMKLWWAFWLISNFASNAAFRVSLSAETPEAMLAARWVDLVAIPPSILAAVFAIMVVRDINRRQEERSQRVTYVASTPPPPPLFHERPQV